MNVATSLMAFLYGLAAGSALLVGAAIGAGARLDRRTVAWIMAFGSGILVSASAFDLMDEAFSHAGLAPAASGFLVGAAAFTVGAIIIARRGGRHRKRSSRVDEAGNAAAIAFGSVIDGIPEAMVIGLMLIDGEGIAIATLAAIFLSNIPEALSSSAGMRAAGRSAGYIFGLWGAIAVMSGVFALIGYAGFAGASPATVAFTQAVAAGALLAMIADTMIPEAFHDAEDAAGLVTALGFISGFALSHGLG